jgi:hypothetical protein
MATEIGDQALALSEPKPTVGVYEYRFATGALAVTNAFHTQPPSFQAICIVSDDSLHFRESRRRRPLWTLTPFEPGDPRAPCVLRVLDEIDQQQQD